MTDVLAIDGNLPAGGPVAHAAERWTSLIIPVLASRTDPRTRGEWARVAGRSPSTIKVWCQAAHLSPSRSLDLARLLRVVVQRPAMDEPDRYLNAVDPRTMDRLLRLGHAGSEARVPFPADVRTFLSIQLLVTDRLALRELARALEAAGLLRL